MNSTYTSPSSPWLPADRQQLLYGLPSVAAPPPPHHLRAVPAGRRIAKRRPRPSRRLPATYINADPANFRRMVHQVTGADDLPPPALPSPVLLRPAPARAASAGAGALMLPTLDTSAFLLCRTGPTARTEAAAPPCDGKVALVEPGLEVEVDGVGGYGNTTSDCVFPTLESWDPL